MGIKVKGEAEIEAKIKELNFGVQRKARAALKSGAELFMKQLKGKTPVWAGEQRDPKHMVNDITSTGIKQNSGNLEIEIGYGTDTGRRVHFPNNGTSKQSPQHFVEETQAEARNAVLQEFLKHLKV